MKIRNSQEVLEYTIHECIIGTVLGTSIIIITNIVLTLGIFVKLQVLSYGLALDSYENSICNIVYVKIYTLIKI